ncbi:hypothetical protein HD554DRAFT_2038349 [Boletus coccyginus]|nr:hypothetical protein HD554DRAFT_2038349 [Boletus coccyginus]
MPDPLSFMLDSMILAVNEGHSYDGIVSLPGIGLEDFGRRPGRLAGRFDDCKELFWKVKLRVTGITAKLRRNVPPPLDPDVVPPTPPGGDGKQPRKRVESKDTSQGKEEGKEVSPTLPGPEHGGGDGQQPRRRVESKDPSQGEEEGGEVPPTPPGGDGKQPRKRVESNDPSQEQEEGGKVPPTPPRGDEKQPRKRVGPSGPSQGKVEGGDV